MVTVLATGVHIIINSGNSLPSSHFIWIDKYSSCMQRRSIILWRSGSLSHFLLSVGGTFVLIFIWRFTVQKVLAVSVMRKKVKKRKRFAVLEEQTTAVHGMCDPL